MFKKITVPPLKPHKPTQRGRFQHHRGQWQQLQDEGMAVAPLVAVTVAGENKRCILGMDSTML